MTATAGGGVLHPRQLRLDDIADLRAYERERDEFRTHVIALKKRRRVHLGDIITLSSKRWGVQVDARITEITEVYGADGETLELTLGYQESIKKILGRITA